MCEYINITLLLYDPFFLYLICGSTKATLWLSLEATHAMPSSRVGRCLVIRAGDIEARCFNAADEWGASLSVAENDS